MPLLLVTGARFSLLQDEEYRAETSLLFRDTGPVIASAEPEREAATNVRLLQLPALTDRVEARMGGSSRPTWTWSRKPSRTSRR